ncbi:MAG: hypothetical protein GWO79_00260, partial [Actinobacteria bacterium]|nr:hypothetical protein [Actinomycetota bacterium]
MIKRKYLRQLNGKIKEFTKDKQGMKVFIFGSSLEKERFGDIDLGVIG